MKVTTERPAAGEAYEAKQPIRLSRGVYGAMFARYTKPARRKKYQSQEEEMKIGLGFVITHSANEQPLPKFSEAFKMPGLKRFYDPKTRMSSTFSAFLNAILSGKHTPEQIDAMADDDLPDLDDLIGYPVQLLIDPSAKANDKGIYHNNIAEFLPASTGMKKAVAVLYRAMETEHSNPDGLRFMKSPKAEFEPIGGAAATAGTTAAEYADEEDAFSEIPF